MTATDWAHLPNAVHIDRVIASVKAHLDHWAEAWNTVQDAGRAAARQAARDVEWSKARGAALDAGVEARIEGYLHQDSDHPVALNFPEGAYLKGLMVAV